MIVDFIARIEGHGSLSVDWERNTVQMNIHEGERLFEGFLVGRMAEEMPWITPRICGVCPIAHNLASLRSIEDACNIRISETAALLRELADCGQKIQSHIVHLLFLSLPDYMGLKRGTDLAKRDPASFAHAQSLKHVGDEIAHMITGRNVHPTNFAIGGFNKTASRKDIERLMSLLESTGASAEWVTDFFRRLDYPELDADLEFVAQVEGSIVSSSGVSVPVKDYKEHIKEDLRHYSTAKFGHFQGRTTMVGALARLSFDKEREEPYGMDFRNPFHNTIAQAVEILLCHRRARQIVEKLLGMAAEPVSQEIRLTTEQGRQGLGTIEAPRGGLYHEVRLDPKGMISYANVITPTVQNLPSMEKSAQILLNKFKDEEKEERLRLLNMLVRSYDPCITCSVH